MSKGFPTIILLLLAALALYLLYGQSLRAQSLEEAQATGWLPAWLDAPDTIRVVERKEGTIWYLYRCLQDAQTGAQWVLRTRRSKDRAVGEGRTAINWATPKKALTAEQISVCFTAPPPTPPEPPAPAAIGEPAYAYILHAGQTVNGPIQWTRMNQVAVAGATAPGERCGEHRLQSVSEHTDPKVGWYIVPGKGVSRCRAP